MSQDDRVYMTVVVRSHHFMVVPHASISLTHCMRFSQRFVQWKLESINGTTTRIKDRVFAAAPKDRSYFSFHINVLKEFVDYLNHNSGFDECNVRWVKAGMYEPAKVSLPLFPHWVARESQVPGIKHLVRSDITTAILQLQTGQGKTVSSLIAASERGYRLLCCMRPKYVEKWIRDISEHYDIPDKDIWVVAGPAKKKKPGPGEVDPDEGKRPIECTRMKLITLTNLVKDGEDIDCKVIIVSAVMMQLWLLEYERDPGATKLLYGISPVEFCEKLKIGTKLVDEVHEMFHLMFKLDLYTHVPKFNALTATLINKDPFITKMYQVMFPPESRVIPPPLKRYTNVYTVRYSFAEPEKIRTKEYGSPNYNHTAFEKSVSSNPKILKQYLDLINKVFVRAHIEKTRKPLAAKYGVRTLIWCASIDMCSKVVKDLSHRYPDRDIRKYTAEDPYSNVMEGEVVVSTIGSSGTALDIPDLTSTIMTDCKESQQANVQALGRTRELKDGYQTEHFYFYAENIPKQVQYHESKKLLYEARAKQILDYNTGVVIG